MKKLHQGRVEEFASPLKGNICTPAIGKYLHLCLNAIYADRKKY